MQYEPRAEVRAEGRSIVNWLAYEVDAGHDPDGRLLGLLNKIVALADEMEAMRAASAPVEDLDVVGRRLDDVVAEAVVARQEAAPSDNPWTGDAKAT